MALTIIAAGSASLLADADYQAELARLDAIALDPCKIFPIDFVNDEIPQGAVLNVGGVIMKAAAAESITGDRTPYVKVDHTTRTASYVASLAGVTWDEAYNGYYAAGDLYLFSEVEAYYKDEITEVKFDSSKTALKMRLYLDGPVYRTGPTKTTVGASGKIAITTMIDSSLYAYIDDNNDTLMAISYSANLFSTLDTLVIAGVNLPAITTLSSSRIAFTDQGNKELRAYDFVAGNLSLVGAGLAIAGFGISADIAGLTSSRVAFIDSGNKDLRAYDFDGANWAQVGNDLNIPGISNSSITALSSSSIAFYDTGTNTLRTYDFDGTDWTLTGNALPMTEMAGYIKALSDNLIIMAVGNWQKFTLYEFNGTDWVQVSGYTSMYISDGSSQGICKFSDNTILFSNLTLTEIYKVITSR